MSSFTATHPARLLKRVATRSVLVEGMDCAGKSTAVRLAQNALGCGHRAKSMVSCNPLLSQVAVARGAGASFAAQAELYASVVELEVRHAAFHAAPLIQESLIAIKSLAMISAEPTVSSQLHRRFELLLDAHPHFDAAIFLTVDPAERRRRLGARAAADPAAVTANDRRILDDPDGFAMVERAMTHILVERFGATVIDTTHLTPAAVASEVVSRMS
jgi:hypothetical protein